VPANGDMNSLTLQTPLRRAYQKGGVFSFDDVDGSDPKALTAFLGALDGQRNYMFPDGMVDRHPDFVCIASANTWGTGATAEYVGRNKVDAAFLSRFAARILIDYDEQLERDLVGAAGAKWAHYVQTLRKVVKTLGLKIPVTPRHTIDGHALLSGGMDAKTVKGLTVYAGLDDDTRNKLMKAVVAEAKNNPIKIATLAAPAPDLDIQE
jgi:MoxR-like ATPase